MVGVCNNLPLSSILSVLCDWTNSKNMFAGIFHRQRESALDINGTSMQLECNTTLGNRSGIWESFLDYIFCI